MKVLADTPVSANTVDPEHSHIPNKTVNARIMDGTPVKEGEFPYMVAIYLGGFYGCGGVILSPQWVLTRAKCLVHSSSTQTSTAFELVVPESEITVRFNGTEDAALNRTSINKVFVHTDFKPDDERNDLALIGLATPLTLSNKVRPARITSKIVKSGRELIALGWGYNGDGERPSILQKIRLTAGSDSVCRSEYTGWDGQDGEFVCTDSGRGRGICDGDGGGPLVLPTIPDSNEDFAGYLVGIASFYKTKGGTESVNCADSEHVANYFTRAAKHIDLIAKVMNVNSSELLATPGFPGSVGDDDFRLGDDELSRTNSATSFLLKEFDDKLLLTTLCSLVLAAIAFNN
jgi:secreted trypsin-like serine protease